MTEWMRPIVLAVLVLLLAACAPSQPAPVDDRSVDVEQRVREPAREEAGVQVYPLKNPAVAQLMEDATRAEAGGDLDQAAVLLERALRIQPRDPELLQQMAELQLRRGDDQQALGFAVRSYDTGPRVGALCVRNWRTIAVAREGLGDAAGANEAENRSSQCNVTRPQGL